MANTTRDLFRAGPKTIGPKFNVIKPGEVIIFTHASGLDYVMGRSGGISTLAAPLGARGKWFCLPAGTQYDDTVLYLWEDFPGPPVAHWSWEPAVDMPLSVYVAALTAVNAKFT